MSDKRVCFDFDIRFSNGGGIQGQDFRLDIDGDDIGDESLAEYIIGDLRLLMVESVEILNKRIIEEEHKRPAAPIAEQEADPATDRFVDLSHVIEDGLITYRGLPGPVITDHLTRDVSREHYAEGTEFQIGRIEMVGNTGTYLDMPFHRYPEGADLAAVVLEKVSNVPGVVVRVTGMEESAIDWHHFAPIDCDGHAVLVHTGWDRHWGDEQYFDPVHPHITEKAVAYLRDQGAALVGIDSVNIDDTTTGTRPAHSVLLAAEIPIVEHLTNVDQLPTSGFRFSAVPPKISGMGTFPVRAHARIPSRNERSVVENG